MQAKLRHFEELGLTITSHTSAVGGRQAGASRVEAAAIGMVDTMRSLEDEIKKYATIVSEAQQVIDKLPSDRFRKILTLHYLCGWTLASISDELRYKDPSSVYRAHGWALAEAQRIINQQQQDRQ